MMPLGRWWTRTADSVLFFFCPPGPEKAGREAPGALEDPTGDLARILEKYNLPAEFPAVSEERSI